MIVIIYIDSPLHNMHNEKNNYYSSTFSIPLISIASSYNFKIMDSIFIFSMSSLLEIPS